MGRISGIVCTATIYRFGGWTFEVNKISGPWPLKKNGDPRIVAPCSFWEAYEDFRSLPKTEQEKHVLEPGGCVKIRG